MFIPEELEQKINIMAVPRKGYYENNNGKWVRGALWLSGAHEAKLINVEFKISKVPFIVCTFRRDPYLFDGLKNKITFAPLSVFYFRFNELYPLCKQFGRELGEKPPEWTQEAYVGAVANKILRSFIGNKINVVSISSNRKSTTSG